MATKKCLSTEYAYRTRFSLEVGVLITILVLFLSLILALLVWDNQIVQRILAIIGFVVVIYYISMRANYYAFQEVKVCKTCGKKL